MTEEKLRSYIKKELRLDEAQGDFSGEDMKNVWKSFTNVFKVIGTALKSILSALVLNVEILFRTDENKIKQSFENYTNRSHSITREYEEVLGPIKKQFESFEPLLFVANPGGYLAWQFAKEGTGNFEGTKRFFQDVGIDITNAEFPFKFPSSGDEGGSGDTNPLDRSQGTDQTRSPLSKILDKQKQLQNSLDRIFGMSTIPLTHVFHCD